MDRTHTTSPTPAEHSLILCPSCSTLLSPPTSRVFRCANCGQSMTVGTRLPPTSMPPSRSPADFDVDFDARVRALLDTFQPGHPRYFVARNVLLHLPRTADNAIDVEALRRFMHASGPQLRGAAGAHGVTAAQVADLPVRVFQRSQLPSSQLASGEHVTCMVCLCEYSDGDELRTLPCLHAFHCECIDRWLLGGRSKQCPVCKTDVDVDQTSVPTAGEVPT